jgi:hypothetical protein
MPSITIGVGAVLTLLGLGTYLAAPVSMTALIPAFFGVVLLLLGLLARNEGMRKHAMHAAAAVALIGFFGALSSLLRGSLETRAGIAIFAQAAMAVLTGGFVLLAVKSFIDARRARKL